MGNQNPPGALFQCRDAIQRGSDTHQQRWDQAVALLNFLGLRHTDCPRQSTNTPEHSDLLWDSQSRLPQEGKAAFANRTGMKAGRVECVSQAGGEVWPGQQQLGCGGSWRDLRRDVDPALVIHGLPLLQGGLLGALLWGCQSPGTISLCKMKPWQMKHWSAVTAPGHQSCGLVSKPVK